MPSPSRSSSPPSTSTSTRTHFEEQYIVNDKTIEWECNWKASVDAFNEVYHVQGIHPQLLESLDDINVQNRPL